MEKLEISSPDELKLACAFYGRLSQIKFPLLSDAVANAASDSVSVSDRFKFEGLVKEATGRFCEYVNAIGIKWLKQSAESGLKELIPQLPEVFQPPTPFLMDAMATCNVVDQNDKIQDATKTMADGLAGIAEVISLYVLSSSVDDSLLKAISQQAHDTCTLFQKTVDSRQQDSGSAFVRSVSQLKGLNEKNEQLDPEQYSISIYMYIFFVVAETCGPPML